MRARLVAESGEFAGATYPVKPAGIVLGRLKTNDVEVTDTKASRRHTRVALHEGAWFVEDLQSSNGTFLNGAKIERSELVSGDKISIGTTVYRFEADDASGPVAAPPRSATGAVPTPAAAGAKPAAPPKPAAKPPAAAAPKPAAPKPVDEPEELHLEEPEELGLDAPAAPASGGAPAAPRAPKAPAPGGAKKPVSATGHGIVTITGPTRPARFGLLTQDLGQRDWRYQLVIWAGAIALFVGLVWGAFRLMDGLLGEPTEPQPVAATPSPAPAAGPPPGTKR
jgi:predicted component of type VI protein secretion system